MKPPIVSVARARTILTYVSHSLLNTTPTAEKPALSEAQRAERLRSLTKAPSQPRRPGPRRAQERREADWQQRP